MKLLVYSHDAFGLGNFRRMLAICEHLLKSNPDLSILLLSGSPLIHSFRLPQGLDYIKLPCLGRNQKGQLLAKFLTTSVEETVTLRAKLIEIAARTFQPDLFLVDKKPCGLKEELKPTLNYLKAFSPKTKVLLLLRDILDTPEVTIGAWQKYGYYQALELFYKQILVVGTPDIFDLTKEYQFPPAIAEKVTYCGYICKEKGRKLPHLIRQELQVKSQEKLVLVTPGGGEDGYQLVSNYLAGLSQNQQPQLKSLIICGPEMSANDKEKLLQMAQQQPRVIIHEFSDDLMSYIEAADVVVSMAGYNTVSEVLSLHKPAVVVPRNQPVQEQLIRAQRLEQSKLLKMIHPDDLTPKKLILEVLLQLENKLVAPDLKQLDFNALPRIQQEVIKLAPNQKQAVNRLYNQVLILQ